MVHLFISDLYEAVFDCGIFLPFHIFNENGKEHNNTINLHRYVRVVN